MAFDTFDLQGHDDDADFKNAYTAFMQTHSTFDDSFMKGKEKKKKEKEDQSLEKFINPVDESVPIEIDITSLFDDETPEL